MNLLMFISVTVIPVISNGLNVRGPSGPLVSPLGSSVVLVCHVDEPLLMEDLEVEWRRTDSETLVHLFQDGESRPEAQPQDYQDRAHFFTEEIKHGNFSLRLDDLRVEDKGRYTCTVHSQLESGETEVQIKDVERLLVSGSDRSISASVCEDVTLNCSVDSHITPEDFEQVSWKKTDEYDEDEDMVLLYQNNEAFPDSSDERYRDRVESFTAEIPKGNFDKWIYMHQDFEIVVLEKRGFIVRGPSGPLVAPLGSSVVLPCHVDEPLLMEDLEVEWRRTDSGTLVHLFLDGESRPEAQPQDYRDRAHFFTEEIKHRNFSLRLDDLRAEDKGRYTCTVHSQLESRETEVQIKDVERLLVSGSDRSISASVGENVTLNCSVDSHITPEDFEKVSWKKTDEDEDILVLLYRNNEALPASSDERYRGRVEFFTAEIPKGNFSIRLKSVRTEDKGVYMCQVFAGRASANATVVLGQLGFSAVHNNADFLYLCIWICTSALLSDLLQISY